MEIAQAIKKAIAIMEQGGRSRSPLLDAYVIMSHCTGRDRLWCHLNRKRVLAQEELSQFFRLVERRARGEPVAYIRGKREFWSRDFVVNPHTLIPRPETELVVEHALSFLKKRNINRPFILDPGTGCGAIAVTLAAEIPDAILVASDIDINALYAARENARLHRVERRIFFVRADWLGFCKETEDGSEGFDLIACNPPYVARSDIHEMDRNVIEFEPETALFSRENGLYHIKQLIIKSAVLLKSGGMLLCEIGWKQGREVLEMVKSHGVFEEVSIIRDYAGHDRLLRCMLE